MDTLQPVGSYADLPNMMHAYITRRARAHIANTNAEKAALSTPEQLRARQVRVRQAFLDGIGGLPEEACALEPVWGELRDRGAYSVQNVMFLAAPDVYVTATVWRPVGWEGQRPGVLYACGHHEHPRLVQEYQEVCTTFALNGYVTLAFDPVAQGERRLCLDPVLKRSFATHCVGEHDHAGHQCELIGHNIAQYMVRDGMRAFDMLASLPEVDAERIAVTGNSGGGTQSSYLMLADERIACAMPCTFTTSRESWMDAGMYHDDEQNIHGAFPNGIDYDDFYFVFAPRPAAIGAVTYDYFPIEGARAAFDRLRHAYAVLGVEEKVTLFEVDTDHQYHPELRRHAVEWFNRWLQPGEAFRPLGCFTPEDERAQWNTNTGQVATSIPGARGVFEQNLAAVRAAEPGRHVPSACELGALLGIPTETPPLNPRVMGKVESDGLTVEKAFVIAERDIYLPVLRLTGPETKRVLVYCCDGGVQSVSAEDEALFRMLAAGGCAVHLVDPRGIGETATRRIVGMGYPTEAWVAVYMRMLGTSVAALRAYDLVRAVEYARFCEGDLPVTLMGRGMVAWSAILAAALQPGLAGLCLEELRPSIAAFATEWTLAAPDEYVIPGLLKLADVPELVAAAAAPQTLVLNPRDAAGNAVSATDWAAAYAPAWSAAGASAEALCLANRVERIAALARVLGG
jgi:hypothetical protein